jgi:DNA ligase (NAD+)
MNREDAAKRIAWLRKEIERHNRLYYMEAKPEVSDREYDTLYDELLRLEESHPDLIVADSPTQRVGGQPLKEFRSVRHLQPMLSLEKKEDMRGLLLFESGAQKKGIGEVIEYIVEPKVDGVSISLHYEDGVFRLGATRGDGTTGDDITANLRTLEDIPPRLRTAKQPPALLEVRGEAYMREDDRIELNAEMVRRGEEEFPNTRNATAGSLKQLDPRVVKERRLHAVFYSVGALQGISFRTHQEELEALQEFGLPIPTLWKKCTGIPDALAYAEEMKQREAELPYDIDGVVLKINDNEQCRRLGVKEKVPAYAVAYKPREWLKEAETRIEDIVVQVGRTGVLTPVAKLTRVFLDGTWISSATLHNADEVRRKDVRIGDSVIIVRAGRVIPAVVRVLPEKRHGTEKVFDMPDRCPECGSKVVRRELISEGKAEVALRCENLQCPAQRVRRIAHFASRGALDIVALGGVVAEAVVEQGIAKDPLDLMDVDPERLAKLNLGTAAEPRMLGPKNAAKIRSALDRSRDMPLSRWVYALGIPDVGEVTARKIAQLHENIEAIAESAVLRNVVALDALIEERTRVNPRSRINPPKSERESVAREHRVNELDGKIAEFERRLNGLDLADVGPVAARGVLDFFASHAGKDILKRFKELKLAPKSDRPVEGQQGGTASGSFTGKIVVITGALAGRSREDAKEELRRRGAVVTESVSGKTHYLVAGSDPGSKLDKARKLGTAILGEAEFERMLKEGSPG